MNLDEIREKLPSSNWRFSKTMEEVGVAIELGITPSQFWGLKESDQAYLLAFFRVKGSMQAFDSMQEEKKASQKNARRRR